MYGNTVQLRSRYGRTWGTTYGRAGVGGVAAINPASFFSSTVTTPAEKTAQYTMIGAVGGAAIAMIAMLAGNMVPRHKRLPAAALIAAPVLGVGAGLLAVRQEYS